MIGLTKTFATVVEVRSNSLISGFTSEEIETKRSGATSSIKAFKLRSWEGLANEWRSETAMASTLSALSCVTRDATLIKVYGGDHRAVRCDSLVHPFSMGAGYQRSRHFGKQVVEVVPEFAPHFQDTFKSFCREKRRLGALALDNGVGHESRPVHKMPYTFFGYLSGREFLFQTLQRPY